MKITQLSQVVNDIFHLKIAAQEHFTKNKFKIAMNEKDFPQGD